MGGSSFIALGIWIEALIATPWIIVYRIIYRSNILHQVKTFQVRANKDTNGTISWLLYNDYGFTVQGSTTTAPYFIS